MSYKKIHLHLAVHPAPTSAGAIDYACALARLFDAKLSVSSSRVKVTAPSHWLAGTMIAGMVHEIDDAATARGSALESHLTQKASALGISLQLTRVVAQWPYGQVDNWYGRTNDLCVLGLPRDNLEERFEVEEWLFGVGRAILDHATQLSASLVVLGAFGRSRLKEFLLGGATKGVRAASRIPLFMSH